MKSIFLVTFILFYLQSGTAVMSVPTDSELVWLKDVTRNLKTHKRTLVDVDLPHELTFHLKRGSHALTLNLKRNHGIDPNADVYVVRNLKDSRKFVEKTRNLKKEDLAYYQDKENGAFMTVRCVRRSNGQCDRVINGNIRLGDRNYDLRPSDSDDVTPRNLLYTPDLLGMRYILQDQTKIKRDISIIKDTENANARNVEQGRRDMLRPSQYGGYSHINIPNTYKSVTSEGGLYLTDKKNKVKQVYWVETAVLIDSGIFNFFTSQIQKETNVDSVEEGKVERKIREFFSHIINGVDLIYSGINDSSIEISITLRHFYILQTLGAFPHINSKVRLYKGKMYVDANRYLDDMQIWDKSIGSKSGIDYDHAMLFTRHEMFQGIYRNDNCVGVSYAGAVCDIAKRTSVVQTGDYFRTTTTAAHELGHNLGAFHDGEEKATACRAEDSFIMAPDPPTFDPADPYSRNPWMFSNCSVESFKETCRNKTCLNNKGVVFNLTEWTQFTMRLPGEVYTPNEQCKFINGEGSGFCGAVSADICRFMRCSDPATKQCMTKFFSAARGTNCGPNKWCKEGLCVCKSSK